MVVNHEWFYTSAVQITKQMSRLYGMSHNVWLITVELSFFRIVNDSRSPSGEVVSAVKV